MPKFVIERQYLVRWPDVHTEPERLHSTELLICLTQFAANSRDLPAGSREEGSSRRIELPEQSRRGGLEIRWRPFRSISFRAGT
jgi:hypothetical protein